MSRAPLRLAALCAFAAALVVVLCAGAGVGCNHRDGDGATAPVDADLMAFLSEARALHHEANLKEDAGDVDGAIDAMNRLVAAARPRQAPEVDEVLSDAFARLAELRMKKGELGPAEDALHRGLAHAPEPTYFRGHLLEVEGLVEEARAASLADAGKPVEARAARERAIVLLEDVVKIQDQVIQRSLANKQARGAEAGR